jgi:hypothetical protein
MICVFQVVDYSKIDEDYSGRLLLLLLLLLFYSGRLFIYYLNHGGANVRPLRSWVRFSLRIHDIYVKSQSTLYR